VIEGSYREYGVIVFVGGAVPGNGRVSGHISLTVLLTVVVVSLALK